MNKHIQYMILNVFTPPKFFEKITNINVFPNYYAICPWIWKIGLINLLKLLLFADETNIFYSHQDINVLLSTINNEYIMLVYLILFIYITMHLHFDCQCLSTNSWKYFLDEAVIARALPQMTATEIC